MHDEPMAVSGVLCLTTDEAARRCSISERSIRDAISTGELVSARLGKNNGAVRIYLPDLIAWIESKRVRNGVSEEVRQTLADTTGLSGREASAAVVGKHGKSGRGAFQGQGGRLAGGSEARSSVA